MTTTPKPRKSEPGTYVKDLCDGCRKWRTHGKDHPVTGRFLCRTCTRQENRKLAAAMSDATVGEPAEEPTR